MLLKEHLVLSFSFYLETSWDCSTFSIRKIVKTLHSNVADGVDRADRRAKSATEALGVINDVDTATLIGVDGGGGIVAASKSARTTANATIGKDFCMDTPLLGAFKDGTLTDVLESNAADVSQLGNRLVLLVRELPELLVGITLRHEVLHTLRVKVCTKVRTRPAVEDEADTGQHLIDNVVAELLDDRAHLDDGCTSVHQLHCSVCRAAATDTEKVTADLRIVAEDLSDLTDGDGTDEVTAKTTADGVLLDTNLRPWVAREGDLRDTKHGVDEGNTSSTALHCSSSEILDVANVRSELRINGDLNSAGHVASATTDGIGACTDGHSHSILRLEATFAATLTAIITMALVGAREVQLDGIGTSLLSELGKQTPISLVIHAHDGSNDDAVRVLSLQLADGIKPVLVRMLADHNDVVV